MSTREAALEAALREMMELVLLEYGHAASAEYDRAEAALSLPPDDLPARMAEGLRPFAIAVARYETWVLAIANDSFIETNDKPVCHLSKIGDDFALMKFGDLRNARVLLVEYEGRRDDR